MQQAFATKDCETNAKDECHTPKDQNSQLQNQLVEEEVHDLTQQVCAIKVDDLTESRQTNLQNSMIIKIKAKYRGKKVRVEKEKKNKDETISNKYAVAQFLPPKDKYKLQILWKKKKYDNCVFIKDIKNLVKGNDISSCTIDAYVEILEKEPQAQHSGDGAEHNGKSFVLSSLYWVRNKYWDKLSKSLIFTQTEVLPHSRTLVPYPFILDSGFFADNLGLAEIISSS
ncbi:hypothetical protein CsSME_00002434 [Camellia sinensis var. sinensis]